MKITPLQMSNIFYPTATFLLFAVLSKPSFSYANPTLPTVFCLLVTITMYWVTTQYIKQSIFSHPNKSTDQELTKLYRPIKMAATFSIPIVSAIILIDCTRVEHTSSIILRMLCLISAVIHFLHTIDYQIKMIKIHIASVAEKNGIKFEPNKINFLTVINGKFNLEPKTAEHIGATNLTNNPGEDINANMLNFINSLNGVK